MGSVTSMTLHIFTFIEEYCCVRYILYVKRYLWKCCYRIFAKVVSKASSKSEVCSLFVLGTGNLSSIRSNLASVMWWFFEDHSIGLVVKKCGWWHPESPITFPNCVTFCKWHHKFGKNKRMWKRSLMKRKSGVNKVISAVWLFQII